MVTKLNQNHMGWILKRHENIDKIYYFSNFQIYFVVIIEKKTDEKINIYSYMYFDKTSKMNI